MFIHTPRQVGQAKSLARKLLFSIQKNSGNEIDGESLRCLSNFSIISFFSFVISQNRLSINLRYSMAASVSNHMYKHVAVMAACTIISSIIPRTALST